MLCPNCQQENRDSARFCDSCGAALYLRCAKCEAELRPDARFCDACGQPVAEARPANPLPSASQPTSFANGRYEVRKFLGEGGKKKVYLAHDTTLDRDIAFALIKTEGLDEIARQRITNEAQAMGRLGDHPNIVTVFDVGQVDDGQPYMVLPLMAGGDVEGLIEKAEEHKLPLELALQVGHEVCQGLEFAHEKGVIHRDLKPGNVWLSGDPTPSRRGAARGVAKIGDFGLAVAVDRSRLTQAGMMVGTVSYMPPEQALGGEVTARSDLYSLGCMLYEMVCGRPPFVGDESVAIIGQHLNTPPIAPTWHRPDCPTGLEALILRLLEKDPSKRPASAAEVREALSSLTLALSLEGRGDQKPTEPSPSVGRGQGEGADPLYRRTFVGREQELKQLESSFDAALSGRGSLAMVVGEPGIGKTALCEQLATYVALRGGKALVGHCYEEGSLSLPYLAFVEAMRSYVLAREPDGLKLDLGTGAADVARIVSEIRDRVSVELRPAGDAEDDRWRLLQAVSSFLRNASTIQPLLIVLEDLHWADRGTLDLLLHVARNLQGARLVIVGTYRDVEVDRSHPLSGVIADLRRIEGFQRVALRGLNVDEVQRMMTNIRGQDTSWARAEQIHRQTEGNPLFVQEVLRYLVEEGIVVRRDGRYAAVNPDAYEASIPEGLRDVIGKRLSRIGPEANRLLSVAAIIGRDFDLATLRAVSGTEEEALLASLEEAVRVGVLEERSQPGRVVYRFAHAFFRQTLYEEMIAPRRLRLHQEVARALEAQYGTRREDHAAELAEHYAQSTDRADLAKAVEYGELAAQRAMSVFAYAEAASHLERCLAVQEVLDPDDRAKLCGLLIELITCLIPAGKFLRVAEDVAERAFSLAVELDDPIQAARAATFSTMCLFRYGANLTSSTPRFREWSDRADRYARPGTFERPFADRSVAQVRQLAGDWAEAWEMRADALTRARVLPGSEPVFAVALTILGSAFAPKHLSVIHDLTNEVAALPREGTRAVTLGTVLHVAARALLIFGEREPAQQLWGAVSELQRRTGDVSIGLEPILQDSMKAYLDGRLEDVVTHGTALIARSHEIGNEIMGFEFAYESTFGALVHLGRAREALDAIVAARRMVGLTDDVLAAPHLLLLWANLGHHEQAQSSLRAALETAGVHESDETPLDLLSVFLEVALIEGDREAAAALAGRLAVAAGAVAYIAYSPICVARLLGGASDLLGRPDEAHTYYRQALEVCEKMRFRPEIALTRLQLAELLLEHYPDERATAIEHLDFAIGEFRDMKMQPSLERALRHRGLLKA